MRRARAANGLGAWARQWGANVLCAVMAVGFAALAFLGR